MTKELIRNWNRRIEKSKVMKVRKDVSDIIFTGMQSTGADYIDSYSEVDGRFMCFEHHGKLVEVDVKVLDKHW